MANGILTQLNKSLEVTLRDGLDGLEDFTLQMAYASSRPQFQILSVGETTSDNPPKNPVTLTVVNNAATGHCPQQSSQKKTRRQRRA